MLLFAACAVALTGCGGGADDAAGSAGPKFLSIGTAPAGGAFYPVGGALADVLNANAGDRGWQVTAEATKGSQENIRRLHSGELDLALANAAISYFAFRGSEGWDRAYDIRAVMTLAPNVAQFLVPAESDVRAIADLKGRRVAVLPAGAGVEYFIRPLLEAHGLSWDDIDWVPGPQASSADQLADGSVDAAFLGGAVPTAAITQVCSSRDIRFLPYEPEAKDEVSAEYVFFDRATIPAGTYRGLDGPYEGLDVGSMHLIAHASAPDDLVYAVTKVLWEQREAVAERHKAGRAIREGNVVRDTGIPFHPGAVRFYREAGLWPEDRDAGAGAD
jgi:TRAP transporter TAXI family solute receptor